MNPLRAYIEAWTRPDIAGVLALRAGDRLSYLREYATTAPVYEWEGTWR